MFFSLGNILALTTGVFLIGLMVWLYARSRRGDQRVINTTNQVLLPILSAIVIGLNILYNYRQPAAACSGALNDLQYVSIGAVLLLVSIGIIRYFTSRSRDRRLLVQPVLLAVIVVTVIFLVEYLGGCLRIG
jgi:uncharacterized membrane protein